MIHYSPTLVMRLELTPVTVQPLPFKALREIAAESLRQAILDGSIRPGQKIMDVEIAAQMGVSRSPVVLCGTLCQSGGESAARSAMSPVR